MKNEIITIWQEGEYTYPMALGFVPNMRTYLHDEQPALTRPCIIIVPGGAYCFVSPSEGELLAKKFYDFGYNAFVLTYTVNPAQNAPVYDQPMQDLSRAIRYVRKNCNALHINPDKVAICGSSAGGHLCASVCVHHKDVTDTNPEYAGISNKPGAAILCYAVISAGEFAHQGSFDALLGADATEEERKYYSLETQVNEDVPPCFLWHTVNDESVPVENSYLFAMALKAKNIPYAHHVFSEGRHGLSTADEAFGKSEFGEPYTMEQNNRVMAAVREGKLAISDEVRAVYEFYESQEPPKNEANPEAALWTECARVWLEKYM